MRNYIIILIIVTTSACTPVRNRNYDDYRTQGESAEFEYQYAEGDSTANSEFFGEDEKSGRDMSDNDIEKQLYERLRKRGEIDNSFEDFYAEQEGDESLKELFYQKEDIPDTTFISLNNPLMNHIEGIDELDLQKIFDEGKRYFDRKYYDKAAKRFYYLYETSLPEDELYYKSVYFLAESHLMKNRFSDALEYYTLLSDKKVNEYSEKSIVRVGQIYCVLNLNDKAETYFSKLKMEYPNSEYLKIANCNSI